MAISWNNTANPAAIRWDSGIIHMVRHTGGGDLDVVYWDDSTPEYITGPIRLYNSSGGYDAYLRNLTKTFDGYAKDDDDVYYHRVEYSTSDISADLKFSNDPYTYEGEYGAMPGHVSDVVVDGFEHIITPTGYITGVPSALSGFDHKFDIVIEHGFEFVYSSSYTTDASIIASLPSMIIVCKSNFRQTPTNDTYVFNGVSTTGRTSGSRHFWIVPTGLITQDGTATIEFTKKLTA